MLLSNAARNHRTLGEYCCACPVLTPVHGDLLSATIRGGIMSTRIFWFDSVLLILCFDEFLLPANFAKHTMALHPGQGNIVVMHAANQLRDTLPDLFICQMIQQMTPGWYKWVLLV